MQRIVAASAEASMSSCSEKGSCPNLRALLAWLWSGLLLGSFGRFYTHFIMLVFLLVYVRAHISMLCISVHTYVGK